MILICLITYLLIFNDFSPEILRVIPKLVIKIPKRESITVSPTPPPTHKKKKKKHKRHHDSEWMPSEEKRKKKKHKHKNREQSKTADLLDPSQVRQTREKSHHSVDRVPHNSNGISIPPLRLRDNSFIDRRLSCLGPASGESPKGTFVVCKLDVFKPDCPLWKVDNQNLLQKYPQFLDSSGTSKIMRYKNSSTVILLSTRLS